MLGGTNATPGDTIEVLGAGSRNIGALAVGRAPHGSSDHRQTVAAIIPGGTASGDVDTDRPRGTPRLIGLANATPGYTIVARGTGGRNVDAVVVDRAPGGSCVKCQAVTAVVGRGTTRGNLDATGETLAPTLVGWALTPLGLAIVVVGAVSR